MRRIHLFAVFVLFVLAGFYLQPLLAQEAVAEAVTDGVASPASEPEAPLQMISTQVVVSYFLVWIGELLKRFKAMPWVAEGAGRANQVMAWIFAVVQAVGISITFDTAAGTLMVTGLMLSTIVASAVEIGRAFVTQKLLWALAFKPVGSNPSIMADAD